VPPIARRTLLGLAVVLGLLLLAGGVLWLLTYGTPDTPPRAAAIPGLSAETTIAWHEGGPVSIDASSEADAYAALGFVHGRRHAWTATLWRQTALADLSTWFGDSVLPMDRLTHRLRLREGAREAFEALTPEEQALLQSYADGMNAAFGARDVRLQDALTLLRLTPEPWEAWHPLAVERLFAWLSTSPLTEEDLPQPAPTQRPAVLADEAKASPLPRVVPGGFAALQSADALLREFLGLHGFDRGMAWAGRDSAGVYAYQQQPMGTSALPTLQPVTIARGVPQAPQQRATIPGTLISPMGEGPAHIWALLLRSETSLVYVVADTAAGERPFPATTHHRRAVLSDAEDQLLTAWQTPEGASYVGDPSSSADSLLTIRWAGLTAGTDLHALRALQQGEAPDFALLTGDGLRLEADGTVDVLGAPAIAREAVNGVLVSNHPWATAKVLRLRERWDAEATLEADWLMDDAYSTWATLWLRPMLFAVQQALPTDPLMLRALVYLRNWDGRFDRSSIGATIVDRWAAAYHARTGTSLERPPWIATAPPDDALAALEEALRGLEAEFGADLSRWRWERAEETALRYPVWSADTLLTSTRLRARERFAPHPRPGHGHLSTLMSGPSRLLPGSSTPAVWEAWAGPTLGQSLHTRHLDPRTNGFLQRYMQPDTPPPLLPVTPAQDPPYTTRLHPPEE